MTFAHVAGHLLQDVISGRQLIMMGSLFFPAGPRNNKLKPGVAASKPKATTNQRLHRVKIPQVSLFICILPDNQLLRHI